MKTQQVLSGGKIEVQRSRCRSRGHRRGELAFPLHGGGRGGRSGSDLESG
jgi:hypothetical protein